MFSAEQNQLQVLIHPQSIVHSMVRYQDGSVLAQMGAPDMKIPIAHCFGWPDRQRCSGAEAIDFTQVAALSFSPVCAKRFPCIDFARFCLKQKQDSMVVLNAVNEVAVEAFLKERIGFMGIYQLIDMVMQSYSFSELDSVEHIINIDQKVRKLAEAMIKESSRL